MRAFRRPFFENLTFPAITADDVYPYIACKLQGHQFEYSSEVLGYYKLPNTLRDFIKQQKRFMGSDAERATVFGDAVISKYQTVTTWAKIKALIVTFLRFPIATLCYFVLWMPIKIQSISARTELSSVWEPVVSTK
jgi:hypothetical protein